MLVWRVLSLGGYRVMWRVVLLRWPRTRVGWVHKLSVVGELVYKMIPNSSFSFLCCTVLIIVWFVLDFLIHVYYLDGLHILNWTELKSDKITGGIRVCDESRAFMCVTELYNWVRQCSLWGSRGGRKTTDDQNMTADTVVCDVRFEAKEAQHNNRA